MRLQGLGYLGGPRLDDSKLEPEQFADIDDSYYAVETSADLDSVMRAVMRKA